MTPTEALLTTRNLTVKYPYGDVQNVVIDDLNLDLYPGQIVGLLGESGSGKSSLALALMGLARHPGVVSGEVNFRGQDLLKMDDEELRQIRGNSIGLITQKPRQALDPLVNVGKQISRVYRAHSQASKEEGQIRAVELLRSVGINDAERRVSAYPHELSGGMAQRALISMALSVEPDLLIADEPTSGLDVTIQAQFLDRMWERARDANIAVLIVTQDLGIVANYCDRIVIMEDGKIIEDRTTVEFFANPHTDYGKKLILSSGADAKASNADVAVITSPEILRVTDLRKTFEVDGGKRLQAVSNASFQIHKGRSLGLVGESGSGKTTVGRLILRLADPDSGEVWFKGERIDSISPKEFRKYRSKIQAVFQDPFDSLNPRWPIERVIREPLDLHTQLNKEEKSARVKELVSLVGLTDDILSSRPGSLSAGQQQRVSLARALATEPEFLILDEPTSALPPAARADMIRLLKSLQERLDLCFIFISHDLSTVRELCHDIAVMYLSEIVEMGTSEQVFSAPSHPYTRALLDSVLFHDPNNRRVDRKIKTELEGEIPSPVDLPNGCYLAARCPIAEQRCRDDHQELIQIGPSRSVRCWKSVEASK